MNEHTSADDLGNWTIKGVPRETRKLALVGARKRGDNVARWLVSAVRNQAALDAGNQVIAPSERPPVAAGPAPRVQAMEELGQVMQTAAMAAQASGVPMPKALARHAYRLMTENLRAARGLQPAARKVIDVDLPRALDSADNAAVTLALVQ